MPIAESIGLAALGWVASPVINDLITKSITYLGSDIAKGLEDLETILVPQFQLTVQAAQDSPHKAMLHKWLLRLKNAYYDAEAIMHEVKYESLRHKVKGMQHKTGVRISSYPIIKPLAKFSSKLNKKASPVTKPIAKFTRKVTEKVSLLSPEKIKLLNRLNKLKKIAAEAKDFCELLKITETENNKGITSDNRPSITTSLLPHRVFGRDGVRDQIIEFLLDSKEKQGSSSNSTTRSYSVVAITGIGGAGKTTLAQYVYNDERVIKHFGTRMWICCSQNMDVKEVTKNMIECITKKHPDLTDFNELQNHLMDAVQSELNEVLLVLDNFWLDNRKAEQDKQWEVLLAPFGCIRQRFKILTTSRSDKFPVSLFPAKLIRLSDLADNDFLSLFRYYTGLQISGLELQNDLYYAIGDNIAKKLSKSPLAARVVGEKLCKNRDIQFWLNTERNVNLSNTMEVLLWSFQLMDLNLQRCFLLFAIFPKGTSYSQRATVHRWVALDLIQLGTDDTRTVEDVGYEYFQLMVANSIIQLVNGVYVMHDLFHDLAEKLSTDDCCCITDYSEKKNPPVTVLHVYLRVTDEHWKDKLSSICHLSNLRTLIMDIQYFGDVSEIFIMISTYFKSLRVLKIRCKLCKTLPRVIGDLRNLRNLDLNGCSIEVLPDTISQLYHLQFLILPNSVKILPSKLSNLIQLQMLLMLQRNGSTLPRIDDHLPPVPYLGRLISLQHLPEFHVRKEVGYELQQLGCLRDIGGCLTIVGLENVRDKDEALGARLIDKSKLTWLKLVWTGSANRIAAEIDVIEALQPPTTLEMLTIDGYRGSVCPTWLQEGSTLPCLQSLGFRNCSALNVLSTNFSHFDCCRELVLYNLGSLKELPSFPVNLHKLYINRCPCLTLLHENEWQLQVDDFQGIVESGFLTSYNYPWKRILKIEVKSFEQTGSVENYQEQLQLIKSAINRENIPSEQLEDVVSRAWWRCHQQRINFISCGNTRANKLELPLRLCILNLYYCCISDGALSDGLRNMASLQKLTLCGIMTITTLPPSDVLHTLLSLEDLDIRHCWCLRSLGGLHALPHLQKFHVDGSWHLEMKNNNCALLVSTLHSVIIRHSIISGNIFHANFQCLQKVIIYDCKVPNPLSFHHLNSLRTLRVYYCSSLCIIKLCPIIGTLSLVELPNLHVKSVLESYQGCRQLDVSSSLMLNSLFRSETFVAPLVVVMDGCEEEAISFEKSVHLKSIKTLVFRECKTKKLPTSLSDFSTLVSIGFKDCPEISQLPELPGSVVRIQITNCPQLRERCQPNGPDWHKIQRIEAKWIEEKWID